jgi:hypothetical protein
MPRRLRSQVHAAALREQERFAKDDDIHHESSTITSDHADNTQVNEPSTRKHRKARRIRKERHRRDEVRDEGEVSQGNEEEQAEERADSDHVVASNSEPGKNHEATLQGLPTELRLQIYNILGEDTMFHLQRQKFADHEYPVQRLQRQLGQMVESFDLHPGSTGQLKTDIDLAIRAYVNNQEKVLQTPSKWKWTFTPCYGISSRFPPLCEDPEWSPFATHRYTPGAEGNEAHARRGLGALSAVCKLFHGELNTLQQFLTQYAISMRIEDVGIWTKHVSLPQLNIRRLTLAVRGMEYISSFGSESWWKLLPSLEDLGVQVQDGTYVRESRRVARLDAHRRQFRLLRSKLNRSIGQRILNINYEAMVHCIVRSPKQEIMTIMRMSALAGRDQEVPEKETTEEFKIGRKISKTDDWRECWRTTKAFEGSPFISATEGRETFSTQFDFDGALEEWLREERSIPDGGLH